jgi:hypothetical protein
MDLPNVLRLHALWQCGGQDGRRANLTHADLAGADLAGANLADANLAGANLAGADLTYADLAGANLADANLAGANLAGANLTYANLTGANLACANLIDANLADAIGLHIASDAPTRLLAVARAALATDSALEMCRWHTCNTTHCISGWAEHLGGPIATLLYQQMGPSTAGLMLLGVEAHSYFFASNEKARAFLQSVVDNAEAA